MTLEMLPPGGPDSEAVTPQAIDFTEVGVLDNLPFSGGFGTQANQLLDPREITVQDIQKMYRTDGHIRSLYRILALPIRTLDPVFTPSEGEGSDGEEEAAFVTAAFTKPPHQGGMTSSFGMVMRHMTKALMDGFAVFEKVWHVWDGRVVYRKLAPRAAETVKFLLDESGGLEAVRQQVHWQGRYKDVVIPARKLLVYTAQHEENPWYGESYLLPAYYHWDVKTKLRFISNLAHQIHAVPGRLGTYPEDATKPERTAFQRQLANFGFNTAMTMPERWKVEEFGGRGTMPDFKAMLDYEDTQAAKSVLAQFMQLGTGSNTGAWALSADQSDLFTMALQAVADEMAEIITFYAVPQLVDFNFGTFAYPVCSLGPLADATKQMMADVFKEIADAGSVNVTSEFLFELEAMVAEELGLQIDYAALREEMRARAEEERALSLMAQRALMGGLNRPAGPPSGDESSGPEDDEPGAPAGSVAASEVIALMDVLAARRDRRGRR